MSSNDINSAGHAKVAQSSMPRDAVRIATQRAPGASIINSMGRHQGTCGSPIPGGPLNSARSFLPSDVKELIREKLESLGDEELTAENLEELIVQILIMAKGPKVCAKVFTPEFKAALREGAVKARMKLLNGKLSGADGKVDLSRLIDDVDGHLINCAAPSGIPVQALTGRVPGTMPDGKARRQPAVKIPVSQLVKSTADAKDAYSKVVAKLKENGVDIGKSGLVGPLKDFLAELDDDAPADDAPVEKGGAAALRAALAPHLAAAIEAVGSDRVASFFGMDETTFKAKIDKAIETYGAVIDRVLEGSPASIEEAAALVGGLETVTGRADLKSTDGKVLQGFSSALGIVLNSALEGDSEALTSTLIEELGERFFQTTFGDNSPGDFGAEVAGRMGGTVTDSSAGALRSEEKSGDSVVVDMDGEKISGEADVAAAGNTGILTASEFDANSPDGLFDYFNSVNENSENRDGYLDVRELVQAGFSSQQAIDIVIAYGTHTGNSSVLPGIPIHETAGEPGVGLSAMTNDMAFDKTKSLAKLDVNPEDNTLITVTPLEKQNLNTFAKVNALFNRASANGGGDVYDTLTKEGMTKDQFNAAMSGVFGKDAKLDQASLDVLFANYGTAAGTITKNGLLEAFDRGALSLSSGLSLTATVDPTILPAEGEVTGDTSKTEYVKSGRTYYKGIAIPSAVSDTDKTALTNGVFDPPFNGQRPTLFSFTNKHSISASQMVREVYDEKVKDKDGNEFVVPKAKWTFTYGHSKTTVTMNLHSQEDRYFTDYKEMMSAEADSGHIFKNGRFTASSTADDGSRIQLWTPREFQFRNAGHGRRSLVTMSEPVITFMPSDGSKSVQVKTEDIVSVDVVQTSAGEAGQVFAITVKTPSGDTRTIAYTPKDARENKLFRTLYETVTGDKAPIPYPAPKQITAQQIAKLPEEAKNAVLKALPPEEFKNVLGPYIDEEEKAEQVTPATEARFEDLISEFDDPPAGLSLAGEAQHYADIAAEAASVPVSDETLAEFVIDQEFPAVTFENGLTPYPLTDEEQQSVRQVADEVFPPSGASRTLQDETAEFDIPEGLTKEEFIELVVNATNATLASVPPENRTPDTVRLTFKAVLAFMGSISQGAVALARGDIFGFNGIQRQLPLAREAAERAADVQAAWDAATPAERIRQNLPEPQDIPPGFAKHMMQGLTVVGGAAIGGYVMQIVRKGLQAGIYDEATLADVFRTALYDAGVPTATAATAVGSLMKIAKGGADEKTDEAAKWVAIVGFAAVDVLSGVGLFEDGIGDKILLDAKDDDGVKVLEAWGDGASVVSSAFRFTTGALAALLTGVVNVGLFPNHITTRAANIRKEIQVNGAWLSTAAYGVSGLFYLGALGTVDSESRFSNSDENPQPVPNSTTVDATDSSTTSPIARDDFEDDGSEDYDDLDDTI